MDVNVTRSLVTHRRLVPTVTDATNELRKAIRRGRWFRIFHIIASWLQVLIGAAITALASGAKIGGIDTSTSILVLGSVSTVTAAVLAYLKGLGEPFASQSRALALQHLLREIEDLTIDSEFPNVPGQDDNLKIEGFRLTLDRILQPAARAPNQPKPPASPVHGPEGTPQIEDLAKDFKPALVELEHLSTNLPTNTFSGQEKVSGDATGSDDRV